LIEYSINLLHILPIFSRIADYALLEIPKGFFPRGKKGGWWIPVRDGTIFAEANGEHARVPPGISLIRKGLIGTIAGELFCAHFEYKFEYKYAQGGPAKTERMR